MTQIEQNKATPLAKGALWLLGGTVPIDDRISWRAPQDHGALESINAFLLGAGSNCVLVEAGVAAHRDQIAAQLTDLLGPDPRIASVAVTRNEPDTISNLPNLVTFAGLTRSFTPGVVDPLEFFDDVAASLQMRTFGVAQEPALPGLRIPIGLDRWLEPVQTPLRLLSTIWYFDTGTGTLFTSDVFSQEAAMPDGAPFVTEPGAPDLYNRMRRHLLAKYDWLAYSNLTQIITDLEALFARLDITALAPSRGRPIVGRAAVAEQTAVLLKILRDVGRNRPAAVAATPAPVSQDQAVVSTHKMVYSGFNTRDIGDDIHLLGGCFHAHMYGRDFHSHGSAYLILGDHTALIIDTGHAKDAVPTTAYLRDQIGTRKLLIMPTHEEYPHAGNLGALLADFPNAQVIGDVRNYHLGHPDAYAAGRFTQQAAGDVIDLGGRNVTLIPAVIHDIPNTLWAYDDRGRMMFVSDAFGFSHFDTAECTLFTEELPIAPTVDDSKQVLDLALYWTRFAEKEALIDDMRALLKRYPSRRIGPAHGSVVTKPDELQGLMEQALHAATR